MLTYGLYVVKLQAIAWKCCKYANHLLLLNRNDLPEPVCQEITLEKIG